jgi:hypothetical protein
LPRQTSPVGAIFLRKLMCLCFAVSAQKKRLEGDRIGANASVVGLVPGTLHSSSTNLTDCCVGMGHGTVLGDEGKAVGCVPPTALLSVVYPLRTNVRTDERNFSANWREHYAGKHEGKRHADKNKNKAVVGIVTRRLFFRTLVDVCFLKQRH